MLSVKGEDGVEETYQGSKLEKFRPGLCHTYAGRPCSEFREKVKILTKPSFPKSD